MVAAVAATLGATLLQPAAAAAEAPVDCEERFGPAPTASVTTTEDRDQMLCQVGYEMPTLGPWVEDPNRPPNVVADPAARLWWDNCMHPVRRGALGGLWTSYDDATGTGAIGQGTGDNPEVDGWQYTPIDLLKMEDGTPVETPDDWWGERRPEIFRAAQEELYGQIPDRRLWPAITWELGEPTTGTADGVAYVERTVTGNIDTSGYPQIRNAPRITGTLRVPQGAHDAGTEVPVVITFGTGLGNWTHLGPQGWGIFAFANNELQPDSGGANLSSYIIGLINKGQWRSPDDWGALAAWSWGISRLIDFFDAPTEYVGADANRIGVAGHSRYGKATTVAAAYDARIKASYTSSSGSLGARMNRRHYGQDLENDGDYPGNEGESREYHWMAGNYFQWMGPLEEDPEHPGVGSVENGTYKPRRLELMSVDGHSMVAMAAPRVVYITGGNAGDAWADPRGMYLAGANATPVYELVGVDGLVVPEGTPFTSGPCESIGGTPPFDQAFIDGYVGFRRQDAGHVSAPGWPAFVEMATKVFDRAPFPDAVGVEAGTTVTSERWTVEGLTGPAQVSVTGGELRTRGGWTSEPTVVENGDTLTVRHTSSCVADSPVATVLRVGDDAYAFTSNTAADSSCATVSVERVVRAGADLDVTLDGFEPGTTVHLSLESRRGTRPTTTVHLGEVTVGADGSATVAAPVAADVTGVHTLVARSGDVQVEERIVIRRAR
jgi:hypothetical protein